MKLARFFVVVVTLPALAQQYSAPPIPTRNEGSPLAQPFSGPAILSRGEGPAAMAVPGVDFRPFVELTGIYDTGLAGVIVDQQGTLGTAEAAGVQFTGGVSGIHTWRHTKLGLDYRGSFAHYTKRTYYDGLNQLVMVGLTHLVKPHVVLSVNEAGGLFSRWAGLGLTGLPQTVPFDPSTVSTPTSDFFDNRTIFSSTQASLVFQRSTRLSFSLGGDASIVRRRSSALYGVDNIGARGDLQYRLTRRSTVGAGYTFMRFLYTGWPNSTVLHSVVGTYSIRLTRTLELSSYAGFTRSETTFQQVVPIDPAIAILIGRGSTFIENHDLRWVPTFSARLSRAFRTGVAYLTAARAVTPGNGLFLATTATRVFAGYSYTGLRRWSFSAQAGYFRGLSFANAFGIYGDVTGGVSASRQLGRNIHWVASYNVRQYQSPNFTQYNRLIYTAQLGFGFTPGDVPLRIW